MTRPSESGRHSATPFRTEATSEWVVPRSMPTAMRRWCGSGDAPGSEICRRDMVSPLLSQLREPRLDVVAKALDEHEGSHLLGGRGRIAGDVQQLLDAREDVTAALQHAIR